MAMTPKEMLNQLMQIEGALCAALVDHSSGMLLESVGSGLDLELAAAGNTEVVRAKLKTMQSLGVEGGIEDILITLEDQMHLIRPSRAMPSLFLYVAIDKAKGNLAMARMKLQSVESDLRV